MSLKQWQAWIEKDNEVQTDANVIQKQPNIWRTQHMYGCIKWNMIVMEMSETLEGDKSEKCRKNNYVWKLTHYPMATCSAFKFGPLPEA